METVTGNLSIDKNYTKKGTKVIVGTKFFFLFNADKEKEALDLQGKVVTATYELNDRGYPEGSTLTFSSGGTSAAPTTAPSVVPTQQPRSDKDNLVTTLAIMKSMIESGKYNIVEKGNAATAEAFEADLDYYVLLAHKKAQNPPKSRLIQEVEALGGEIVTGDETGTSQSKIQPLTDAQYEVEKAKMVEWMKANGKADPAGQEWICKIHDVVSLDDLRNAVRKGTLTAEAIIMKAESEIDRAKNTETQKEMPF